MSDAPSPRPAPTSGDFTLLLQRAEAGDARAADQILPLVYGELRKLAAAKMAREAPGHTLQPTALVHEAWLRLGGDAQPQWKSRAQFFAAAAEAMRRILIESARRRHAARHGGGLEKVSVNATGFDVAAPEMGDADLLLLHEALDALAAHDARKAEMVKQWYFVGLNLEEIAQLLDISLSTANRDIRYARAWLGQEILRLRQVSAPRGNLE
jgi:RNA polymerase sigma factor (TIGR02999 family)